jgi:hypothetical protein
MLICWLLSWGSMHGRDADQRTVDADLEARWHGPCCAALALAEFHTTDGYRGLPKPITTRSHCCDDRRERVETGALPAQAERE